MVQKKFGWAENVSVLQKYNESKLQHLKFYSIDRWAPRLSKTYCSFNWAFPDAIKNDKAASLAQMRAIGIHNKTPKH